MNRQKIEDNISAAIKEGKIYNGQIIKNYREFCRILGEEKKTGGSTKVAQIKKWNQYMKIKKIPHSQNYLIEEIYERPKYKDSQVLLKHSLNEIEMGGVYKIEIENYKNWGYTLVYIGSTVKFRKRFNDHKREDYKFSTGKLPNGEDLPSSSEIIKEGGIFSIVRIFGDFSKMDTKERKEKIQKMRIEEEQLIKEYGERNDLILINRVIDNKHIFSKNYNSKRKFSQKTSQKTQYTIKQKHNNKNYKFTLDATKKELFEGISKIIEKSIFNEIISRTLENKTTIVLPYSIKIGEEEIKEYKGKIEISSC